MDMLTNSSSLRKLILASNGLSNLILNKSGILDNLTFLDIRHNMLKDLDEKLFESLKNVKTLWVLNDSSMIRGKLTIILIGESYTYESYRLD